MEMEKKPIQPPKRIPSPRRSTGTVEAKTTRTRRGRPRDRNRFDCRRPGVVFRSNGRSGSTLRPGRLLEGRGAGGLRRGGWSARAFFSPLRRRGGGDRGRRTVEEDFVGYRRSVSSPAGADGGGRRPKERGEPERRTRITVIFLSPNNINLEGPLRNPGYPKYCDRKT